MPFLDHTPYKPRFENGLFMDGDEVPYSVPPGLIPNQARDVQRIYSPMHDRHVEIELNWKANEPFAAVFNVAGVTGNWFKLYSAEHRLWCYINKSDMYTALRDGAGCAEGLQGTWRFFLRNGYFFGARLVGTYPGQGR